MVFCGYVALKNRKKISVGTKETILYADDRQILQLPNAATGLSIGPFFWKLQFFCILTPYTQAEKMAKNSFVTKPRESCSAYQVNNAKNESVLNVVLVETIRLLRALKMSRDKANFSTKT